MCSMYVHLCPFRRLFGCCVENVKSAVYALNLHFPWVFTVPVSLGMVSHVSWVLSWICGHKDEEENSVLHHESQQVPCMSVPDPLPRAEKRQDHRLCRQRLCSERICHPSEQVMPYFICTCSHTWVYTSAFTSILCLPIFSFFFFNKVCCRAQLFHWPLLLICIFPIYLLYRLEMFYIICHEPNQPALWIIT